jgi:hypothetical protein
MKKTTSLLIAGTSALISMSLLDTPAYPSQVIVSSPKPSKCRLLRDNQVQDRCRSFKLTKLTDEDSGVSLLMIEFSFDDLRVTYSVESESKRIKKAEHNGKKFTIYPILTEIMEQRGLEPRFSNSGVMYAKPLGTCVLQNNYNEVACTSFGTDYIYTGKSALSQSSGGSSR